MSAITLLTDFGTADSYVAEMKGVLATGAPDAPLIDLSHAIPPGDVRTAAFVFGRAWPRFPPRTVHLVVVDPGVGSSRAPLAVLAHGQAFVGPDNGVLTSVFTAAEVQIVVLPTPADAAPTFHGRDLFAPAAVALVRGTPLVRLGTPFTGIPERLVQAEVRREGNMLTGEVVHVDRFGTLVTNLPAGAAADQATIELEGLGIVLQRSFSDVAAGGLVAFVGSGGTIEVAVRNGSAARRLGLGVGGVVRMTAAP